MEQREVDTIFRSLLEDQDNLKCADCCIFLLFRSKIYYRERTRGNEVGLCK